MGNLIIVEALGKELDVTKAFVLGEIDDVIGEIEKEAKSIVADVNTAKGRGEIKSLAYKIARSKTTLDQHGKALTSEWREKISKVDAERRKVRCRLDKLKAEVRRPLTEWEEEQKAKEEAERLKREIEAAHEEALAEYAIWLREKEIAEKEARLEAERLEIERKQAEIKAKEEEERARKEREEREAAIAREAAEKAKKEQEEKAKAEIARLEAEKAEAERCAREAEERKMLEIEAAKEKAKREAEEAAKREAARAEEEKRLAQEKAERAAAKKEHRAKINRAIHNAMTKDGLLSTDQAKAVIKNIVDGRYPHVTINY